eukprot:2653573-Amphidinium_carterae.1
MRWLLQGRKGDEGKRAQGSSKGASGCTGSACEILQTPAAVNGRILLFTTETFQMARQTSNNPSPPRPAQV